MSFSFFKKKPEVRRAQDLTGRPVIKTNPIHRATMKYISNKLLPFLLNWKTTLAGVALVLHGGGSVADALHKVTEGSPLTLEGLVCEPAESRLELARDRDRVPGRRDDIPARHVDLVVEHGGSVALESRGPVGPLSRTLRDRGVDGVELGPTDVPMACGAFYDAIAEDGAEFFLGGDEGDLAAGVGGGC
jgi:hypothetical protein